MRSTVSLPQLLQHGQQARTEGRLADAQAAFAEVLRHKPEQPAALHLLGELAQLQGDLQAAEDWLARSLQANPGQAPVWARLGSVRETLGRAADAEECFRRAAELMPGHVQALAGRARLLHAAGRPDEAAQSLARALRAAPHGHPLLPQLLVQQALLQQHSGQLDQALASLDQALHLAPRLAAAHHHRGMVLQRLGRAAPALAALEMALDCGRASADTHHSRAGCLQSLGRPADALQAYRAALQVNPQHASTLHDSARLRWRMGHDDFTADLDAAAAAAPGSAVPPTIKGRLLLRAGHHAAAATAFAQAVALADTVAVCFDGLGQALGRLGRFDDALAAHSRAVELAPDSPAVHINHASTLLQAGQPVLAVHAAETALRLAPWDQQAWALLGLAWRATGDPRDAWLNDCAQHVQVFDLPAPSGWADAASFNAALAAVLEQLHTDAQAPIDQSLRHGSQTLGNIFDHGHPLLMQLKACISQAVDRYVANLTALPRDDGHPLRGRVSRLWRFTDSWSSRLGSGGFHAQHVHANGWISSCYYVALPPAVGGAGRGQGQGQAGWITFGEPDIQVPGCDTRACRAEPPAVGRLVLFPSFLWHGTVPFVDTQPRLTVAFDVMPV